MAAAGLAFALGASALAPMPRARTEPVATMRSAAVAGFFPSSMTAAAEVGDTALDLGTADTPAEAGLVVVGPLPEALGTDPPATSAAALDFGA